MSVLQTLFVVGLNIIGMANLSRADHKDGKLVITSIDVVLTRNLGMTFFIWLGSSSVIFFLAMLPSMYRQQTFDTLISKFELQEECGKIFEHMGIAIMSRTESKGIGFCNDHGFNILKRIEELNACNQ